MEKYFKAKVVGKWIKGSFWKRPMVGLKFELLAFEGDKYLDVPAGSMAKWHDFNVGDRIDVKMSRETDGFWYPVLI